MTLSLGPWTWRVLAFERRRHVRLAAVDRVVWEQVDLGDGTSLAQVELDESAAFVHLRADALREETVPGKRGRRELRVTVSDQPRGELRIVGRSLVEILTHVLDHGVLPPGAPWSTDR